MNLFKYFASFERLALPKLGVLFEFDLKEYLLFKFILSMLFITLYFPLLYEIKN